MDVGIPQPRRAEGGSPRRWGPRIATCALFAAGTAMLVSLVAGGGPTSLFSGPGAQRATSAIRAPDLIAGHIGWCRYGQTSASAETCAPVAPPLPTTHGSSRAAPCRLTVPRVDGLVSKWGQSLATVPAANPSSPRGSLLSCASNWYAIAGRVVTASILVDARRPGSRPPGVPGLRDRGGVLEIRAAGLSARRVRNAWLVLRGGTAALRATLLTQLHVDAGV